VDKSSVFGPQTLHATRTQSHPRARLRTGTVPRRKPSTHSADRRLASRPAFVLVGRAAPNRVVLAENERSEDEEQARDANSYAGQCQRGVVPEVAAYAAAAQILAERVTAPPRRDAQAPTSQRP